MTEAMLYVPDGPVLTRYFWDRSRISIIQGPIGSGTSSCSCHRIWAQACEQAPDYDGVRRSRWIVTRDTYKELRETTIKTWLEWFPESEWGPMIRSEPALHHLKRPHPSDDGSFVDCEVIFVAIPHADVAEQILASYEFTGFFRNEAQFVEKAVVDELLSRCGRYPSMKGGPGATWFGGFLDLNAPLEGHWIPYMRGDMPLPPDWTDEQKDRFRKPDNWTFYLQPPGLLERKVGGKIVYEPNPAAENQRHLRQGYMEQAVGKPKEWIDRRILNKVGIYLEGKAVYPTFSEADHVAPKENQPIEGLPIIVGLDFGRDPAACFGQCVNGQWRIFSELIGDNESAQLFAPRVKRHLAQFYGGFAVEFWGDPRGGDRTQSVETTAYDIFAGLGMRVMPATTDNNPEMRRSAVGSVLDRRAGMQINPSCLMLKTGFAGGYHYPKIKGTGMFAERPRKNRYSHIVEAAENMILGGGEGDQIVRPSERNRPPAPTPHRHKIKLRRFGT